MKHHEPSYTKELELPRYDVHFKMHTLAQTIDWGLKQLNVPETWSITQGDGITAMVIDTGHPVHPDIGDNAIEGKNFIHGEPLEDENGHHTHCTGIICAKHNDLGMVGVAPEAKCISVKNVVFLNAICPILCMRLAMIISKVFNVFRLL